MSSTVPPVISIIVAMDHNGVIGRDGGGLPWHLPEDLQQFKRITWGKPIIMGRRTHASIGRPLPGRDNIVVTRNPAYQASGCRLASSLADAIALAAMAEEVFIIGGAALYREALPRAARLYLTEVHADVEGDVRFPPLNRNEWREVARTDVAADARNAYARSYVQLVRVPPAGAMP